MNVLSPKLGEVRKQKSSVPSVSFSFYYIENIMNFEENMFCVTQILFQILLFFFC